jgi:hypothetical protein
VAGHSRDLVVAKQKSVVLTVEVDLGRGNPIDPVLTSHIRILGG